jgi:hypothetical protein
MLNHAFSTLLAITVQHFPIVLIGNQIADSAVCPERRLVTM